MVATSTRRRPQLRDFDPPPPLPTSKSLAPHHAPPPSVPLCRAVRGLPRFPASPPPQLSHPPAPVPNSPRAPLVPGQERHDGLEGSMRALTKDKAAAPGTKLKVPFHDPSIPRPQDVYKISVDNYKPFKHFCLEHSKDGTRPVHPLEKLPVEQLIDRNVSESESVKPADLEDTPFTLVEDLRGLKELSKKLKTVTEFAVGLEHNQYRSFQGLTCLMQISTRTEDFIVDTLKLHIHIGLYLQKHFIDPAKRKVMHGADRDIMWLQRDFHIYLCNLFDTGQASRVLQMESNGLEQLLQHFCGVAAKTEYNNADWRARPLPDEMIKYAREGTHYLLYIYDMMRQRLQRESNSENDLLLEVYKHSNEIRLQLYEKEVLTDKCYLHIYGYAVPSAPHKWRDGIARQEDESTGYILSDKTLLEIAKQIPSDAGHLKRMVNSKYPFVESHLDEIVHNIKNALEYSHLYEGISEELKKQRLEQSASRCGEAREEMAPLDADIDRSNPGLTDQSTEAFPSSANVNVASDSGSGIMSAKASGDPIQATELLLTKECTSFELLTIKCELLEKIAKETELKFEAKRLCEVEDEKIKFLEYKLNEAKKELERIKDVKLELEKVTRKTADLIQQNNKLRKQLQDHKGHSMRHPRRYRPN
ncbi:hypothetical protein EJB05_07946, partial [Eragrostis curvula]